MKKFDFSIAPTVLTIVLGIVAEINYRRAVMLGLGTHTLFTRPSAIILLLLCVASIILAIIQNRSMKKKLSL